MATSLSHNLKLRIDSNLTANARYNLERLDLIGANFLSTSANDLLVRSQADITIEPQSADIDGTGVGGTVNIGSPDHQLDAVNIYADALNIPVFNLADTALGGDKSLLLAYKSDIDGSVDTVANRTLNIDLNASDRNLVLGGNFSLLSNALSLTLPVALALTLPSGYGTNGQILTTDGSGILSWASAGAGSGDVSGFTGSWASGDGTTKVITHSLLSDDVEVVVIDDSTDEILLVDSIVSTDSNNITLISSEAPASSWRVVVQAK